MEFSLDTRRDTWARGVGDRPGRAPAVGARRTAARSRPSQYPPIAAAVGRAALALGIAALAAAAAWAQPDRRPPAIERLEVVDPPRPEAPLGARIAISTDEPARLTVEIADGARVERRELDGRYRTAHVVPLTGLRPGRTHAVTFTATDAAGNRTEAALTIDTAPLPDDFPPLAITVSQPDRMEPGSTLFNVYRWGPEGRDPSFGLLVAVDAAGDVVWYYRAGHVIANAVPLANGNLLYMANVDGIWALLVEIDLLGNVVRGWHPRALAARAPAGSLLVDTDSLHHDMVVLPSGNLASLSSEVRTFHDYPTSEEDPAAPRATRDVVGDLVVEFTPEGTVVREWSLLDALDPYRIAYDSLGTSFWGATYRALGRPDAELADWTHGNALAHDARDDTFVISARHQDALVKLDRSGAARWILAPHAGWSAPWRSRLLSPRGDLEWPYHGHGIEVTPHGTILVFDNGNHRATPFDEPLPPEASYSRAVEFDVDEAALTVRQRWAYPPSDAERFYSSFLSDADWLPDTGNVLITDGGRTRTVDTAGGEPEVRRWARILEVTRGDPAETVFELVIDDDSPTGWHVYRAERWRMPLVHR